ncbi:hypothetical protein [Streptomyces sp. NBC_01530]|uniref:hypothetical protein n=1 Tax=Streptomyces sp. NBC_01530 TaxID=2903895 RepID=UPI00386A5610
MAGREPEIVAYGGVVALAPGPPALQQALPGGGIPRAHPYGSLHLQHRDDPLPGLLHGLRAAQQDEGLSMRLPGRPDLGEQRLRVLRRRGMRMRIVAEVRRHPVGRRDLLLQRLGPARVHREPPFLPTGHPLAAEPCPVAPDDRRIRAEGADHDTCQRGELLHKRGHGRTLSALQILGGVRSAHG